MMKKFQVSIDQSSFSDEVREIMEEMNPQGDEDPEWDYLENRLHHLLSSLPFGSEWDLRISDEGEVMDGFRYRFKVQSIQIFE